MKLKNLHIKLLFFLFSGLLSSAASAFEACYVAQEEVVSHTKIIEMKMEIKEKECPTKYRKDIDAAKAVVKAFWLARKNHLSFFSEDYKKSLQRYNLSFKDVHKYMFYVERVWEKQKYINGYYQTEKTIKVVVLSSWFQEGDEGTTTFNFYLINENGKWKIDTMIY